MGDTTAMNTRDTAAYSGGTVIAIRSAATTFRQRFAGGMRMTVRSSSVVHAVSQQKWLAGELVPVPLCHIGVYGLDFNSVHPTRLTPTCRRCLSKLAQQGDYLLPFGDYQPPLFRADALMAA